MPGARRPPRREGRSQGSELLTRILIAVPAAILVLIFIDLGGIAFALFMIAVGWLCLHELYRMLDRWRPLTVVGFASVAGMVLAAHYGTLRNVLEVTVATLPVLFLFVIARGQGRVTVSIAGTLLGIYWIGFAVTHGELLRQLPHGNGVVIDVLVGTFVGDTGAYIGGRMFGRRPLAPQISPNKTVGGPLLRNARRDRRGVPRRAVPGLVDAERGAVPRARRGDPRTDRGPVRVSDQTRCRYKGHRERCSDPTGGSWTARTPRCSRSWRATTCGSR